MIRTGAGLISFLFSIILALAGVSIGETAHASLGANASSVRADAAALNAVVKSTTSKVLPQSQATSTVYEMSNGGLTVREYARPDGTVFGIAWKGMNHPDLQPLLGTYFKDFSTAHQAKPKHKGPRRHGKTQGQDIVVEKSGHMRSVYGRAYVPSLLPQGVTPDEIQ